MATNTLETVGSAAKDAVTSKAIQYQDIYTTVNDLVQGFWERMPYFVIALIIFIIFWLVAKLFKLIIRKTLGQRAHRKQNLVLVLSRLGSSFIIFLGFLIAMVVAIPGFTPAQLISALGIGSVAIGFAFKDIFQNLLSGILLLLSEPFRIGDQIVTNNYEGTVEDIQIRATYIKTYDGRRIVIPNADLYTNPVQVNTAFNIRRIQVEIGIGYGDPINETRQLMLDILDQCPSVYKESKPTVVVTNLADFAVIMRVRWWIDTSTQMNVISSTDEVLTAMKYGLTEAGVDMPFPTSQILLHDQTEDGDGDRSKQREGWPHRKDNTDKACEAAKAATVGRKNDGKDPSESSKPERD